ncbi:protein O-mannosyl-transferase TMTC3 [Trichonephila clavipes]|uniref:Protein O-mannosyl-transferase TMTC3 n=1 Tax=Trichonephila clavipes TaxID=2585209 RepID=A0A8X6USB1_TRICX|nr:protein O-mannosyl-transferase TMTC3 [Trichonephila clavipes]
MCSRRHGGGRVRSTTPAKDRYIVLSAKRNRCTTAQQVANQFLAASGKQISRKTVARRLRGGGLYVRRPVVCVPLTRQHRTTSLQWCREHHNWTEQDWACVLFSDESRFSLSSDCRRQLTWRESGTAYRPENIQEKDRYPTCSIMVWAGIMINGRTRLHVVANGTMTGQRYIDEILLPHVRLFCGAVGDKFVFMDDNATCHRTLAVQDCLDSEGIQRLVWPAHSSDLNPIENVWDALGRQVAGRNYRPTNKNTLIRALTEEWDKLPQQLLDNVVQSMVKGGVNLCCYLTVGIIAFLCYLNALNCDFVFDDMSAIRDNQDLRPSTSIFNLLKNDFWGTPIQKEQSHKSYRPLCVLTYRINYYFHKLQPYGYHLTNIVMHAIVSTLYMREKATLAEYRDEIRGDKTIFPC